MSGRALATTGNSAPGAVATGSNSPVSLAAELPVLRGRVKTSFTDAVLRAFLRTGLSEKEIAAHMRLTPSQWSRQKASRDGHRIQVQRIDEMPDDVLKRYLLGLLDELAPMLGLRVVKSGAQMAAVASAMLHLSEAVSQMVAREDGDQ